MIDIMADQKETDMKGGTMRLGLYSCAIKPNTKAAEIYQKDVIEERHRHRYEFNNHYLKDFQNEGMVFSGIHEKQNLVEILELPSHPWFVAVQFHPEYKSTVANHHPIFVHFVKAAIKYSEKE